MRPEPPASKIPDRIRWAVEQLRLRSTDTVLEVGTGGGHALALVGSKLTRGNLTAIDRSAVQVKAARARNRDAIRAGRLRIERLTLDDAPTALGHRFDKVLAVNVNAFWTAPDSSLSSLQRLLLPIGRVCLVYQPPSLARARALSKSLPDLLRDRGWRVERTAMTSFARSHGIGVVARPP
jgi:SAM-dependent methyltransferase